MALIRANLDPTSRDLAWFSVVPLVFFGILGAVLRFQFESPETSVVLWVVGFLISGIYCSARALRRPIYILWMRAVAPIGWTIWNVSMVVTFFLILTPIGIVMRILGRDPLQRDPDHDSTTYWIEQKSSNELSSYFEQF